MPSSVMALNSTPISLKSTFLLKFSTPTKSSPPLKNNATVTNGRSRRKGWIHAMSKLNAVNDDTNNKAALDALKQLDSQLEDLAEKEVSKKRNAKHLESDREKAFNAAGIGKVEWPEFSPGFLAFVGIGLLLLTVVNNVLFYVFVEPSVRKSMTPPSISNSSKPQLGYKVESFEAPPLINKS